MNHYLSPTCELITLEPLQVIAASDFSLKNGGSLDDKLNDPV